MPDSDRQQPGRWNRVVLRVSDLPATIDALKKAGVAFRNQIEAGPGGWQIQVEDPGGNPVEPLRTGEVAIRRSVTENHQLTKVPTAETD